MSFFLFLFCGFFLISSVIEWPNNDNNNKTNNDDQRGAKRKENDGVSCRCANHIDKMG